MSEVGRRSASRRRPDGTSRWRDAGMSLTEVLVATLVMGLMITTLAMATRVIIQQADNTEGRSNNARSEQNVGLYMPADLSSAEIVNVEPGAVPCGPTPACPPGVDLGGSNALMLTWSGQEFDVETNSIVTTVTNVSYRVVQLGEEFRLLRIECNGFVGEELSCMARTVLRNLDEMHARLQSLYPDLRPPSFDVAGTGEGTLDVHYRSERVGLVPFVVGLLEGLGDLYGTPASVTHDALASDGTDHEVFHVRLTVPEAP